MGLYQYAYPIYVTLLAISTAGLPTAISKLVSEKLAVRDFRGGFRIFRVALVLLTGIGIAFTILLMFSARFYAERIIKIPDAYLPILSIAPAIFFVSVMSAYRGLFQGMQNMVPSAISQIVEQIGRVITVFALVIFLMPRGLEYASAGAAFGPVTGGLFGLVWLLAAYYRRRKQIHQMIKDSPNLPPESISSILTRLINFAVPITIGGFIIPAMNMVDQTLISRRLLLIPGMTTELVKALYGRLSGIAGSMINFPAVITIAISASIVPAVAEGIAKKNFEDVKSKIEAGIKITLLIGLPSALGLTVLATPISDMLFRVPEAGDPLAVLAYGVIFLTLNQTCAGILQGLGRVYVPVRNLLFGVIIKIIINYFLTPIPSINIIGPAIGTVVGYAISSILNLYYVIKLANMKINYKEIIFKPVIAAVAMALAVMVTYRQAVFALRSNSLATLAAIGVGVVIYAGLLIALGAIREKELSAMPHLVDITKKILNRFGFFRR
jgi:stage V sporulation protein B